jgi:N-acetylglucosamine repressor
MEISNTAVTNYINDLLATGIIIETGTEKSSGGRKPPLLDMNPDFGYIVGIDFGQSNFRIAAFNLLNQFLYHETISSFELRQPSYGIPKMIEMVKKIVTEILPHKKLLAIGIAVSGIVNQENDACMTMANLLGWEKIDFRSPFENNFHVPVYIDDSPRMAALCESIIPTNGRYKNLIYINIGMGIGTGIIIYGRLYRGAQGLAGELGHIIVQENGLVCGCGNRGCLEQYASVPAMVKSAKDYLRNGVRSMILDHAGGDIEKVDSYALARALDKRDKLALNILIEAGNYLGKGISQIIDLFNPERIIIGGGGMNISNLLLEEAIRICQIRSLNEAVKSLQIVKSSLGDDAVLVGVSIFVQDNLFELTQIQQNSLF